MKKFILPVILPLIINLIALFIFISPAQAINLNGEWVSQEGAKVKLSQSGDTFSLIITDSRLAEFIGSTTVKGTITGDTFVGQVYYLADECPNLNGFVPARGTISEGKIEVKFTGFEFDPDTCVEYPNSEFEHSTSYTRIITPSPTFAEKPEAEKQEDNTQPDQIQPDQTQSEEKENLVIKALGGFPIFIGDWFSAVSTGWGMQEFFYQNELFADEVLFGRDRREIAEEKAKEEEKEKMEAQEKLEDYFDKQGLADINEVFDRISVIKETPDYKTGEWQQNSPFRLDILRGQAQIKYPGESEWRDIKVGDKIPPGSTIFTGMDATTVLSIRDKGVVQVLPFTEVTITEEGLADPGKTTTEIKLRTGEIELNVEGGVYTGSLMNVLTPTAHNAIRGTHFWVRYDKDKRLSTTGVYKGQVEVKALGSDKLTMVSPNGDKPGIVMIAQKLSVAKLTLVGLVLLAIIIGAIFFIRRRGKKVSVRRR